MTDVDAGKASFAERKSAPIRAKADRTMARLLGCILLCFAMFAIWPEIDLRVSGVFHSPPTGFLIDGNPLTEAVRHGIWTLGIVLCSAAVLGTTLGLAGRALVLPTRAWGFILALYALGPGVMVELLTKPLWGRARPAQIVDFGGTLPFTPANEIADFCSRNCSFVSGEVTGATVTALALLLLRVHLKARIHSGLSALLLIAACCLPPLVALQRIAAGRHFLSDTAFAVLFTLLLALALSVLMHPLSQQNHRSPRSQAAIRADRS